MQITLEIFSYYHITRAIPTFTVYIYIYICKKEGYSSHKNSTRSFFLGGLVEMRLSSWHLTVRVGMPGGVCRLVQGLGALQLSIDSSHITLWGPFCCTKKKLEDEEKDALRGFNGPMTAWLSPTLTWRFCSPTIAHVCSNTALLYHQLLGATILASEVVKSGELHEPTNW